jgi:hypothetical protein
MSVNERRKYLKRMKVPFMAAKRGELLIEMELVTELYRKCLMHVTPLEPLRRKTTRARQHGVEVERVIMLVLESRDYMCAELLTPCLLVLVQHLARFKPLFSFGNLFI